MEAPGDCHFGLRNGEVLISNGVAHLFNNDPEDPSPDDPLAALMPLITGGV